MYKFSAGHHAHGLDIRRDVDYYGHETIVQRLETMISGSYQSMKHLNLVLKM